MANRLSNFEFIQKSKMVHNNKYSYDDCNYINSRTKVSITCLKHGNFECMAQDHIHLSSGCPICANIKNTITNEEFINKSKKKFKNLFDYSKTNYKHSKKKIIIICNIHGEFLVAPATHLQSKHGCVSCAKKALSKKPNDFIIEANTIHDNKYRYDNIEYINNKTKVLITCPIHGNFLQQPQDHLMGNGCPTCAITKNESKGVRMITKRLNELNIKFIKEKTFDNCININKLRFDFYLPDHNILIEFDGKQHFKECSKFGGIENLLKIQHNDKIKNAYCKDFIPLLRIKYNDDILKALNNFLKEYNVN